MLNNKLNCLLICLFWDHHWLILTGASLYLRQVCFTLARFPSQPEANLLKVYQKKQINHASFVKGRQWTQHTYSVKEVVPSASNWCHMIPMFTTSQCVSIGHINFFLHKLKNHLERGWKRVSKNYFCHLRLPFSNATLQNAHKGGVTSSIYFPSTSNHGQHSLIPSTDITISIKKSVSHAERHVPRRDGFM